jgi:hypothetical protein
MKKIKILALTLTATIAGCGGSGGGTTHTGNSPFQGEWVGFWERPTFSDYGRFDMIINGDGTVTGTSQRIGNGNVVTNGTIKDGIIQGDDIHGSHIQFRIDYPTDDGGVVGGTIQIITVQGKRHLEGDCKNTIPIYGIKDMTFDLVEFHPNP